ncbi:MAG: aldo/keto reductase [Pseudomonadota bacterium]
MQTRKLGRTGIDVPVICLGTMTWGSQNTESEAHEQMNYAMEMGVNFFDTAEMYPTTPYSFDTHGDTERHIGTWFAERGKRDDVILATKVIGPGGHGIDDGRPNDFKKVKAACERSLARLQTDYIDLYQVHWPNRGSYHFRQNWGYAPWNQDTKKARDDTSEILRALHELVEEGKVRHVGLSNDTVWGTMQYLRLADAHGWPRIASVQNEYSMLHRLYDLDMAEMSHHEDIGLLTYTSLAGGLLTGKYEGGAIPEGSRGAINPGLHGRIHQRSAPAVTAYLNIARKHGLDPTKMALAWCLIKPFVTSIIIGATSMEQLKTCIDAEQLELPDGVVEEIEAANRQHPMPL